MMVIAKDSRESKIPESDDIQTYEGYIKGYKQYKIVKVQPYIKDKAVAHNGK